jgi:hypothetical protein
VSFSIDQKDMLPNVLYLLINGKVAKLSDGSRRVDGIEASDQSVHLSCRRLFVAIP